MAPSRSLKSNKLGANVQPIAEMLKVNKSIVEIECAIATSLPSCHDPLTLVSLPFHSLRGNSLKEVGAKHLASALAVNQTLTSVKYAASHPALAVTTR